MSQTNPAASHTLSVASGLKPLQFAKIFFLEQRAGELFSQVSFVSPDKGSLLLAAVCGCNGPFSREYTVDPAQHESVRFKKLYNSYKIPEISLCPQ